MQESKGKDYIGADKDKKSHEQKAHGYLRIIVYQVFLLNVPFTGKKSELVTNSYIYCRVVDFPLINK